MMVDRAARNRMAELLRHLITGKLTNDEYDNAWHELMPCADDAVVWLHVNGAWFLYSDVREHRLVGRYAPTAETRRLIARAVLFLKTDHDYEWPQQDLLRAFALGCLNIATLGLVGWLVRSAAPSRENEDIWPF